MATNLYWNFCLFLSFFSQASVVALGMGSSAVCWSVAPPLRSRLKYLNFCMDCYKTLFRHSWSSDDESYWRLWSVGQRIPLSSKISQHLLNGLEQYFVRALMVYRHCIGTRSQSYYCGLFISQKCREHWGNISRPHFSSALMVTFTRWET